MQCVKNMQTASEQMNDNFLLGLLLVLVGASLSLVHGGACLFVLGLGGGFVSAYVKDALRKHYYAVLAKRYHDNILV
jgi:hypothetical protein